MLVKNVPKNFNAWNVLDLIETLNNNVNVFNYLNR